MWPRTAKSRTLIAIFAGVTASAGVVSGGVANAVTPPVPTGRPPTLVLDPDAHAALDWSVPERYERSWEYQLESVGEQHRAFFSPATWSLTLDGCKSRSLKHPIVKYSFTVSRVGSSWQRTFESTGCRVTTDPVLPGQGAYTVDLTLHTGWSRGVDGVSAPVRRDARIRDYLIVSMGDSLASGEGNPDTPKTKHESEHWRDRYCHRSVNSGPSRFARHLEKSDPKTSVTFISVACSGAELKHLISDYYKGIEKIPNAPIQRPQVDTVTDLVGPDSSGPGRTIDALLLTAGLNDLGFAKIIRACALNNNHPAPGKLRASGGLRPQGWHRREDGQVARALRPPRGRDRREASRPRARSTSPTTPSGCSKRAVVAIPESRVSASPKTKARNWRSKDRS